MASSSTSMDIDSPSPSASALADSPSVKISLHPLAIVSMADQYTRISRGGTPMEARTTPAVGVLCGTPVVLDTNIKNAHEENNPVVLQICDAVEVVADDPAASAVNIGLHQAVYTQQLVVGWYRVVVAGDKVAAEPTAEDLLRTQQTVTHNSNNNTSTMAPLFLLLTVEKDGKPKTMNNSKTTTDPSCPISIFQLEQGALVHQPDWKLETAVAEKIAVERVLLQTQSTSNKDALAAELQSSELLGASLGAFQERMGVLQDYLAASNSSSSNNLDPTLLRKIQVVVWKARLLNQHESKTNSNMMPLLQEVQALSSLANTLDLGRQYATQKSSKSTNESSFGGGGGGPGSMRRMVNMVDRRAKK